MKDLSLFLLKNSLASRMKKGFRNFCHGVSSTSTLRQKKAEPDVSCVAAPSVEGSYLEESNATATPLTLEQMILQLDMEEEAARREQLDDYSESSFRNLGARPSSFEGGRRSRNLCLPPTVAGENVVWCKPGVVAKLMGLDAVPVPIGGRRGKNGAINPASASRKQSLRRNGRHELEKERVLHMGLHGCKGIGMGRESSASCSAAGYCVMNPISVDQCRSAEAWRFGRAR
ncbi:unnamed protein product [Musa acuminata subsp. malaccensis]|uniref:(wild Malaysian banana) hypothetical protein n=1 Tax=Musa acuminata subsp. malaccensis TaxID=214687 RepID=A0A804JNG1_MUSAM|nr:unnamed protein product [Musa acuminata subsp. malaccensis]